MGQHLFNLLRKKGLTPNQYCVLWYTSRKIHCNQLPDPGAEQKRLQQIGFLDENYALTETGQEVLKDLESVFRKTKPAAPSQILGAGYSDEIKKYREKFPAHKKGDQESVTTKLAKLFAEHPEITWDTVHEATDLYLSEQNEEKYIMKAGNFIEKDGVKTLLGYCERILEGENAEDNAIMLMFKAR